LETLLIIASALAADTEGLGPLLLTVMYLSDGLDQLWHVSEYYTSDTLLGQFHKPPFCQVQPLTGPQ
jgi:hypothetical protein